MRSRIVLAILLTAVLLSPAFSQKAADENSLVIVFRDGSQKTYSMTDIARIEFNTPTGASLRGQNRFLGKWRVGTGTGSTFTITLERGGIAKRSIGAAHGKWVVVGNEARITWDDGWHDTIRKAGNSWEKVAHEPGKKFTDEPDNVTKAENTDAEPL